MPEFAKKHNQNNSHKEIKPAVLFDFKLNTVGGRLRVSHTHFAAVFDISPQLVEGVLMEWAQQPGQSDTVWQRAVDVATDLLWADATAVLVLVDHFRCQPTVAEKLLTEMGFYQDDNLGVAA